MKTSISVIFTLFFLDHQYRLTLLNLLTTLIESFIIQDIFFSVDVSLRPADEMGLDMKLKRIPLRKPTKKEALIIIGLAIILIVASLGISITINPSVEDPVAAIQFEDKVYRIGEIVQFNGEDSKGDIEQYQWDFGEGNYSEEENPAHIYNESGWYQVNLVVRGTNKAESNNTVTIGIQRPDEEKNDNRGPGWVVQRGSAIGGNILFLTHPNIGNPRSEGELHVSSPIGSVEIFVVIEWFDPTTGWNDVYIYQDEYIATGSDININYIIEPEDFPQEINDNYCYIILNYYLHTGRDGGVDLTASIEYPVEGLSPP